MTKGIIESMLNKNELLAFLLFLVNMNKSRAFSFSVYSLVVTNSFLKGMEQPAFCDLPVFCVGLFLCVCFFIYFFAGDN